ncbi:hypothetical protein RRG08_005612 [Elysia crispata]|uniref:Uncharacterized protein n=1 Tax=Elysia crispata TaxID=231223 RepID=A0AAE1D6C2_9GAST|nr:hypothetical protein RRG08_005612 [Elysia crispata]
MFWSLHLLHTLLCPRGCVGCADWPPPLPLSGPQGALEALCKGAPEWLLFIVTVPLFVTVPTPRSCPECGHLKGKFPKERM